MIDPRDPDLLVIHVNGDLDRIARQRYIEQAKAEYGIEQGHRRRSLVAPLVVAADAARQNKTATAAAAGVVAAAAAAAVVLPATLDSNTHPMHRHSPVAAAPLRPGPDGSRHPPGRNATPSTGSPVPVRPATTPLAPPSVPPSAPGKGGGGQLLPLPATVPPTVTTLPTLPAPPVTPPGVATRRHVTVRIDLGGTPVPRLRLPLTLLRRTVIPSPHANP